MFSPNNFRLEVDSDVISGVAVDNVGVDVPVKFGDSRSNAFRDIPVADFVSNKRTSIGEAYPNSAKRKAFRPKTLIITVGRRSIRTSAVGRVVVISCRFCPI